MNDGKGGFSAPVAAGFSPDASVVSSTFPGDLDGDRRADLVVLGGLAPVLLSSR